VTMKKILIVTYYWPPMGGGGVQRWLKFAKYLPTYGWRPVIYTPQNPDFYLEDKSFGKDISKDLEIIRRPIWEPYSLVDSLFYKKTRTQGILNSDKTSNIIGDLLTWIRGNLFIPDPKVSWVKPSVLFLERYIKSHDIDYIVTTGPPHSMHLIGQKLHAKNGIKWIADFRDPWSRWDMLDEYRISNRTKKIHKKLESKVVSSADAVLSVSPAWAEQMQQDHQRDIQVLTNGYDPTDFPGKDINIPGKFVINHSGLLNNFRNPIQLWDVLAELCIENQEFNESLSIRLSGMVTDSCISYLQEKEKLNEKFEYRGYISHDEVLRDYSETYLNILLLNNTQNAHGHLPGKLFEYLASKRFILGLGPKDCDAAKIIHLTATGRMCIPEDKEGIKKAIIYFFKNYQEGKFPLPEHLDDYDREVLTGRLSGILDRI